LHPEFQLAHQEEILLAFLPVRALKPLSAYLRRPAPLAFYLRYVLSLIILQHCLLPHLFLLCCNLAPLKEKTYFQKQSFGDKVHKAERQKQYLFEMPV